MLPASYESEEVILLISRAPFSILPYNRTKSSPADPERTFLCSKGSHIQTDIPDFSGFETSNTESFKSKEKSNENI